MESASLNSSVTFMENRAEYDFMARVVVVGSLVGHMEMQQEQPQQRQQQLLCLHHVPCRMSTHSRCDREREREAEREWEPGREEKRVRGGESTPRHGVGLLAHFLLGPIKVCGSCCRCCCCCCLWQIIFNATFGIIHAQIAPLAKILQHSAANFTIMRCDSSSSNDGDKCQWQTQHWQPGNVQRGSIGNWQLATGARTKLANWQHS